MWYWIKNHLETFSVWWLFPLCSQNGSIMEGLALWKNNVDKRFEGVEDCMICFSVIHGFNYSLPKKACRTCKKKFHSACLVRQRNRLTFFVVCMCYVWYVFQSLCVGPVRWSQQVRERVLNGRREPTWQNCSSNPRPSHCAFLSRQHTQRKTVCLWETLRSGFSKSIKDISDWRRWWSKHFKERLLWYMALSTQWLAVFWDPVQGGRLQDLTWVVQHQGHEGAHFFICLPSTLVLCMSLSIQFLSQGSLQKEHLICVNFGDTKQNS